jgi:hypothetical protein
MTKLSFADAKRLIERCNPVDNPAEPSQAEVEVSYFDSHDLGGEEVAYGNWKEPQGEPAQDFFVCIIQTEVHEQTCFKGEEAEALLRLNPSFSEYFDRIKQSNAHPRGR